MLKTCLSIGAIGIRSSAILFALLLALPESQAREATKVTVAHGRVRPLGSAGTITPEEAVKIIARKLGRSLPKRGHLDFDRSEDRGGRTYFVIHGFEIVLDDPKTGDGHTATWGWFFVDRQDGTAYKWDLAEDKLVRF